MKHAVQAHSPVTSSPNISHLEIECDRPPVESKQPEKKTSETKRLSRKTSKIKVPANASYFDWRTLNWSMTLPKSQN